MVNIKNDPFERFEDWLVAGPAGAWPASWDEQNPLTPKQKKIVSANAKLLQDEAAWKKHVVSFEAALAEIDDKEVREDRARMYEIRFDRHNFKTSNFVKITFPCLVSFGRTIFSRAAFFHDAIFTADAIFSAAVFSGNTHFDNAAFRGDALFFGATFSGDALFQHTAFSGEAIFLKAEFYGNVHFDNATLGKSLYLSGAQYKSTLMSAADMKVEGNMFVRSTFRGGADFSRIEVKGTSSLSGAEFSQIPNFSGAKLERPPEVAGMVVPKPKMKKEAWWDFSRAIDRSDVSKFRKLKAMALQANDHEKDGEFFAKEMMAKRGVETTSFSGLLFNTLYWKSSDFGQSFVRPLVGMVVSLLFFFLTFRAVILANFATRSHLDNWVETYAAFHLSLRNVIPFFGSLFRFSPQPEGHKSSFMTVYHDLVHKGLDADWLVAIGIVQNIIGAVLLFLFLLALRNKFRLK